MSFAAEIAVAHRLADAAREAIRPHFRAGVATEHKGDASPVTVADRAAEEAMRRILAAEYPQDGVVGEEFGAQEGRTGRQWVLDPIDGTVSFIAGRPIFGTLIALMQDGWPVLGVIDQAITGERWVGQLGGPTTLNGREVRTRSCKSLDGAMLATSSPHYFGEEDAGAYMKLAQAVGGNRMQPTIIYGGDCYNYGLLAAGHLDIVCEAGLALHDYAALVPIVEGAGGMMSDWQGHPLDAESAQSGGGRVIALGDPARLEDLLEALSVHAH